MNNSPNKQSAERPKVTGWSIFKSALAGLLGVQKRENLERDFGSGKFWHFFVAGALVSLLFLGGVWAFVAVMLKASGT